MHRRGRGEEEDEELLHLGRELGGDEGHRLVERGRRRRGGGLAGEGEKEAAEGVHVLELQLGHRPPRLRLEDVESAGAREAHRRLVGQKDVGGVDETESAAGEVHGVHGGE